MKITTTKQFLNRVLATEGFVFNKESIMNANLFDEDEIQTLVFKYDCRVVCWNSIFDLSDLTPEQVEELFKPHMVAKEQAK